MNKVTTMVFAFVLALTFSTAAHAAPNTNWEPSRGVGFAVGPTTGLGISFAIDSPRIGLQVTGFPAWVETGGMLNAGVNVKFHGWSNDKIGFFGSVGMAAIMMGGIYTECSEDGAPEMISAQGTVLPGTDNGGCVDIFDGVSALFVGGGGGFQLTPHPSFMLRLDIPVAFRYSGEDDMGVIVIPSLSLLYRW